ncbi:MAG: alpha/beta hydrolase family protein [Acidimicrobiia bacterium]
MNGPDLFDALLRLHGAEVLGREYLFVRLARINIAGHLDYSEVSRILTSIRRRSHWFTVWMEASERHESLARTAATIGATASAGDGFLRAALCAHWSTLFADENDHLRGHRRSLELYQAGSPWFDPPSERHEVAFDGEVLPGYLRRPAQVARPRLVVMVGGADTNKEELHHWGTEITRRGMAVFAFDGPGQGEHAARYERLLMRFDRFHHAISAVLDWATGLPEVETDGFGLFGNSLGGYLALDAALRDPRVKAVISNGGFCDGALVDSWPPGVLRAFAACLGIRDNDAIVEHLREHLNLLAVPVENRPAALIVHGGLEDLVDESESQRAADAIGGTLFVINDGWHTATNRDHLASPVFADWMFRALSGARQGPRTVHAQDERDFATLMQPWNN